MLYVFRFLLPLRFGLLLVCCLYKQVYLHFLNMCPFDYTAVAGTGKIGPVNRFTIPVGWLSYSNWPSLVGPQSLCNRTFLVALFVLSLWPFDISVCIGAFLIGLSQISSFVSFQQTVLAYSISVHKTTPKTLLAYQYVTTLSKLTAGTSRTQRTLCSFVQSTPVVNHSLAIINYFWRDLGNHSAPVWYNWRASLSHTILNYLEDNSICKCWRFIAVFKGKILCER